MAKNKQVRFFQEKKADIDVLTRKRYQDAARNAETLFNALLKDKKNDPNVYLAILDKVFKVKVTDQDLTGYNISNDVANALTKNPETTAISFLVFAKELTKNTDVMSQLKDKGLLKTTEGSQKLINKLDTLVGLLENALGYRAVYKEFSNKVFVGALATACAGLLLVFGSMAGPVGLAIAGGILACVAAIAYLAADALAPHGQGKTTEKLRGLETQANDILRDSGSKVHEELEGFVGLLRCEISPADSLADTSIFRV